MLQETKVMHVMKMYVVLSHLGSIEHQCLFTHHHHNLKTARPSGLYLYDPLANWPCQWNYLHCLPSALHWTQHLPNLRSGQQELLLLMMLPLISYHKESKFSCNALSLSCCHKYHASVTTMWEGKGLLKKYFKTTHISSSANVFVLGTTDQHLMPL